jgi:hypothetical protein
VRIAGQVIGLSIAALTLGAWPPLGAQAKPDARAGPCAAAEHRQFDFWLGDWQVRTAGGKPAGANTIRRTPRRLRAARELAGREWTPGQQL